MRELIGAALMATFVWLSLLRAEVSSASFGKLVGLLVNGFGVMYLATVYQRLQQFVRAQCQPSEQLLEQRAKVEG